MAVDIVCHYQKQQCDQYFNLFTIMKWGEAMRFKAEECGYYPKSGVNSNFSPGLISCLPVLSGSSSLR